VTLDHAGKPRASPGKLLAHFPTDEEGDMATAVLVTVREPFSTTGACRPDRADRSPST
jgi:hypothetical protein